MSTREIILAALVANGPMSVQEVGKLVGIGASNVQWHMREMHMQKLVHIAAYIILPATRDIRVWAAGEAFDAIKPGRDTRRTRSVTKQDRQPVSAMTPEQLERMQEEFEAREDAKRRQRLLSQIQIRRDPLVEAFFGAYA